MWLQYDIATGSEQARTYQALPAKELAILRGKGRDQVEIPVELRNSGLLMMDTASGAVSPWIPAVGTMERFQRDWPHDRIIAAMQNPKLQQQLLDAADEVKLNTVEQFAKDFSHEEIVKTIQGGNIEKLQTAAGTIELKR